MRARATPQPAVHSTWSQKTSSAQKRTRPPLLFWAVAIVVAVSFLAVTFQSSAPPPAIVTADSTYLSAVRKQAVAREAALSAAATTTAAAATAPPALRHEVEALAPPPEPLAPLLASEPPPDAPASCNARAHTELEGGVVQWGSSHLKDDAAACCAACSAHAAAAAGTSKPPCNLWVFCPRDSELCTSLGRQGQCWLKHTLDPSAPPSRGSGPSVPWTSGSVLPEPAAAYRVRRRWVRARRQRSELTMLPTARLAVGLRNETGTVELLTPEASEAASEAPHFSFTLPLQDDEVNLGRSGHLDRRPDGFHHLGDLTLRVGGAGGANEVTCSSVYGGAVAAAAAAGGGGGAFARGGGGGAFEWTHTRAVPLSGRCPVTVERQWAAETAEAGGALRMTITVRNGGAAPLTLSALGLSMPFDQDFVGRTLTQVAHQCSFVEPYLGAGGGYVQVTAATGDGPALLLVPLPGTELEAWRPLRHEDKMRLDFMYEMTYELVLHSASYAKRDWRAAAPWNTPTSAEIPAGGSATYGLRILVAPSVRRVEHTLLAAGVPLAAPLPGPVLHADVTNASLLLRAPWADAAPPTAVDVTPADALAVDLRAVGPGGGGGGGGAVTALRYALRPRRAPDDGRVRVVFTLAPPGGRPPLRLAVHLFVARPAAELVRALGTHSATSQWLPTGTADPWHRDGAFFGWDHAAKRAATQERRVYMSGLSDEAGAAAGLAVAMKQLGQPAADEVAKLEEYVAETLYQGDHPDRSRFLQGSAHHDVRLSMLYWTDEMSDQSSAAAQAAKAAAPELARVCKGCWPKSCSWMDCWSESHSLETWRSYNYPHVTAVYWSLYRLGRWHSPPLTRRQPWQWYLRRAHKTAMALWTHGGDPWTKKQGNGTGTAQWGLMVGSVFELLLTDLYREGWVSEAREMQAFIEKRIGVWLKMPFPYGSEFAWDSTGHEEIATWMLRFGKIREAEQTTAAVTAYVSLSSHWAYCGSARRWWDFTINGALQRGNERGLHHYAAALNSVPIFELAQRATDDDERAWLWRLAGCAGGGTLTNVRQDGSASMAWHGDPDVLKRDDQSADFGVGFYGHWKHAGSYLSCSAALGWLCIGCDVTEIAPPPPAAAAVAACADAATLKLVPRDAFRRRLYVQPLALMLVVDGAAIATAAVRLGGGARGLTLRLSAVPRGATHAMLTLTADVGGAVRVRLKCAAPCGFEPSGLSGAGAEGVHRLRLGGDEATLEVELLS